MSFDGREDGGDLGDDVTSARWGGSPAGGGSQADDAQGLEWSVVVDMEDGDEESMEFSDEESEEFSDEESEEISDKESEEFTDEESEEFNDEWEDGGDASVEDGDEGSEKWDADSEEGDADSEESDVDSEECKEDSDDGHADMSRRVRLSMSDFLRAAAAATFVIRDLLKWATYSSCSFPLAVGGVLGPEDALVLGAVFTMLTRNMRCTRHLDVLFILLRAPMFVLLGDQSQSPSFFVVLTLLVFAAAAVATAVSCRTSWTRLARALLRAVRGGSVQSDRSSGQP